MDILLGLFGLLIVFVTVADAFGTLVVTRGEAAGWRPTRAFYTVSWRLWGFFGRAARNPLRRERFLSLYAPLSLIGLLLLWLTGLLFGWALVLWPFRDQIRGTTGFLSLLYYSGAAMLTIGFGDIVPRSAVPRLLTLVEAVTGLGTIAMVVSYLPALYGAFSRREARLLTLDHPEVGRLTPVSVITINGPDADLPHLYAFFHDWELWTAEVLESHVSYPMLALFRSQHPGQSWIGALGVVVDAATVVTACVPGAERREPYFMHRRGERAITEISLRFHRRPGPPAEMSRRRFHDAYTQMQKEGYPLRDIEDAWARVQELRAGYSAELQDLITFLRTPAGFWGHSADDVAEELA